MQVAPQVLEVDCEGVCHSSYLCRSAGHICVADVWFDDSRINQNRLRRVAKRCGQTVRSLVIVGKCDGQSVMSRQCWCYWTSVESVRSMGHGSRVYLRSIAVVLGQSHRVWVIAPRDIRASPVAGLRCHCVGRACFVTCWVCLDGRGRGNRGVAVHYSHGCEVSPRSFLSDCRSHSNIEGAIPNRLAVRLNPHIGTRIRLIDVYTIARQLRGSQSFGTTIIPSQNCTF